MQEQSVPDFEQAQLFQAYLYVAGEMSSAEAHAFEVQLQDSPELCELVAQATLMNEALATAYNDEVLTPNIQHAVVTASVNQPNAREQAAVLNRSKVYRAVQVATLLCVIGIPLVYLSQHQSATDQVAVKKVSKQELTVQQMSGMLDEWLEPVSAPSESTTLAMLDTQEEEAEQLCLNCENNTSSDVPEWLLVALQVSESESTEGDGI